MLNPARPHTLAARTVPGTRAARCTNGAPPSDTPGGRVSGTFHPSSNATRAAPADTNPGREAWLLGGGDNAEVVYIRPR